jgi:hypothetical protein
MAGWAAFGGGLKRATRYGWLLVLLFAVNLLSALCLAALPAATLLPAARRPVVREAADGVDAWLVVETLLVPLQRPWLTEGETASPSGFGQAATTALLAALLVPVAAWLPSSLLGGGVLLTLVKAPQPFCLRRFLWGCWHWFGAFLLLGLAQGGLALLLFAAPVALAVGLGTAVGAWTAWGTVPLLLLGAAVWLAWCELTRVGAVAEATRNIARAALSAGRFLLRRLGAVALLYGAALALLLLVHALFRLLLPLLPLDIWPLAMVVQQFFILARLWTRLVRLGGSTALWLADRTLPS